MEIHTLTQYLIGNTNGNDKSTSGKMFIVKIKETTALSLEFEN